MTSEESASSGPAPGGAAEPAGARALDPRSFKLRFAAQREPGRSYVSAVKPLVLPATVTGKFYARAAGGAAAAAGAAEERRRAASALRRVRDMFVRGPRERHAAPALSSHEYGWWWDRLLGAGAPRGDRRLQHHVRDSAWMRARLRVLAADQALRRR